MIERVKECLQVEVYDPPPAVASLLGSLNRIERRFAGSVSV